jgi:hypothetical protein
MKYKVFEEGLGAPSVSHPKGEKFLKSLPFGKGFRDGLSIPPKSYSAISYIFSLYTK